MEGDPSGDRTSPVQVSRPCTRGDERDTRGEDVTGSLTRTGYRTRAPVRPLDPGREGMVLLSESGLWDHALHGDRGGMGESTESLLGLVMVYVSPDLPPSPALVTRHTLPPRPRGNLPSLLWLIRD